MTKKVGGGRNCLNYILKYFTVAINFLSIILLLGANTIYRIASYLLMRRVQDDTFFNSKRRYALDKALLRKISLRSNYALSFHQFCVDVLRSYYQVVHRPSEFSRKLLPSPQGEFCQNIALCCRANHECCNELSALSFVLLAPYNNRATHRSSIQTISVWWL